ncbi:MAG TPA: T9SS type B sorting domain-containing protein [Flavobacteriaceae bacterium]|nr:T9SS type B sorting domain-containing protein [Flavobacteriaceae bacterium]
MYKFLGIVENYNRFISLKLVLLAILCSHFSFANGFDFNLTVTVTDETCLGNGSLQMSVSGTATGSTISYELFLLPDTTNPIAQTTTNSFNNLPAGDYRVEATETLNGNETVEFQDVSLQDLTEELDFTLSQSTIVDCDATGIITVTATSGNPVSYEIVSGPVTVSPQPSNSFSNLPPGTYVIRVYDDCNNAITKTYTLILQSNNITVSEATLPVIYDSCDSATLMVNVGSASENPIVYPLTITFTIYPPDGSPAVTHTLTVTAEEALGFTAEQLVDLYNDQPFEVEVTVTDECGNVFTVTNEVDPNPEITVTPLDGDCGLYFQISYTGYSPPYSITFTDAPADFDPVDFNEDFPGPFTASFTSFGEQENVVPEGLYDIEIVDSCGRTATHSFTIEEEPLEPILSAFNNGCDLTTGRISITLPESRVIVSASIEAAPTAYQEPLPVDVSQFIDEDNLTLDNMPVGDYIIHLIDECGDEYFIEINIPETELLPLFPVMRPDCDAASGSLSVFSPNGQLEIVLVTAAPPSYSENLPVDVSSSINSNGGLYLFDLPVGNYVFETTDVCGNLMDLPVEILDYQPTPYAFSLTRNCGSFDILVVDTDQTVTTKSFWFQKFFPSTNSWGHPYTGEIYTEGSLPNTTNSIQLQNEVTLFNIFLTGEFRVLKAFQSYNDLNNYCFDILEEFTISSSLIISGIYDLNCQGGSSNDIVLDVVGVEPFHFTIQSPMFLDNGSSNIFSNLPEGIYEIRVEDPCGNIENILVNTENLLPLARANTPDDMLVCKDNGSNIEVFDLSAQTIQILGSQNPNDYLVTYHETLADANSGNNPLNVNHTNTSNPQIIYARVEHETLNLCYATTSFSLFVGNYPAPQPTEIVSICEGGSVTLTADSGYNYEWSNGATSQSIVVHEAGTYSVTLMNSFGAFSCDATQEFTVVISDVATIESITTTDWTVSNNTITVTASGIGDYVYSINNINFQESSTFTGLTTGIYTVYVMDLNGCGTVSQDVALLNYPAFFTPNGDGFNDTWQIKHANLEPDLKVNIFDRYGKLLTNLNGYDIGWDGTYNGYKLPTSDYWFVVTRANGVIHKGHFTLKR